MQGLTSVVAKKEFDLNGLYGEKAHFFKVDLNNVDFVVIHDELGQGSRVKIKKTDFEENFIVITDEEFNKYQTANQEGYNREIQKVVEEVIEKYKF